MKNARVWKAAIKLCVTLAFILFLLLKVRVQDFPGIFFAFNWFYIVPILLCNIFGIIISCYRIGRILSGNGHAVGFSFLVESYMVGRFFNVILPGSVSGDIVRIRDLIKKGVPKQVSVASIVIDRLSGLMAIILLVLVLLPFSALHEKNMPLFLLCLAVSVSLFLMLMLLASRRMCSLVCALLGRLSLMKACRIVRSHHNVFIHFFRNRKLLLETLAYSLLFVFTSVFLNYLLFQAFSVEIGLVYVMIFIPIIQAITMVPVTINGIGLREGSYALLFSFAGVSVAQSVSVSLSAFALTLFLGVVGWIFYSQR